jgi:hypothetical protein
MAKKIKKVKAKGKKVKAKAKKVVRPKGVRKPKKNEVALLKQQLAKLKRESNAKEAEMNRLRKDVDMESHKKVTEEKIFQLEAKVKELEGKTGGPSFSS